LPHYERVDGDRTSTVTVLFTDLVASTQLRSRLGDLAADALRREHTTGCGLRSIGTGVARSRAPATASWRSLPPRPREKTP
jgi:class 3 adenylate cyclase